MQANSPKCAPADHHALLVPAYRTAIGTTFLTGAGIAALAFAIVLFLPERPLRGAPKARNRAGSQSRFSARKSLV